MTAHSTSERGEILWTPAPDAFVDSGIARYLNWAKGQFDAPVQSYGEAWQWSVDDIGRFWHSIWEYFSVLHSVPPQQVLTGTRCPTSAWFTGARLNYAENVLRWSGHQDAVIAWNERGEQRSISRNELRDLVTRVACGLSALGVTKGDRVAGYLPNVPETLIALLATAQLGAIWTCCPPEFGDKAVVDRLQQVAPRVLITADGYIYRGQTHDRRTVVENVRRALDPATRIVWLPLLGSSPPIWATAWDQLIASPGTSIPYEQVPFDFPLWILYSSGSTGLPKAIMHSHGGITLEHLKSIALQVDVREGSRTFQYTSSGWVMWNIHIGSLLVGATALLYDGAADYPDIGHLWRRAADLEMTAFGTSPAFLARCRSAGIRPVDEFKLGHLRTIGSTGAPLAPDMFRWVFDAISHDVFLRSTSGGTDVCTSILGCSPILPTRAGEIQCRPLGVAAFAFDDTGRPLVGRPGELVVTKPMPSMPVGLWGDTDRSRLREAYFDRFQGIWHHGDWVTVFEDGSGIVHGRSDATLKRGGIRIGTAELYRVLDDLPLLSDSTVVDIPLRDGASTSQMVLFVVPRAGHDEGADLIAQLRSALRTALSPRHVPDKIIPVPSLPRTLNGKRLEVQIKRVLMGTPAETVISAGNVQNQEALRTIESLRSVIFDGNVADDNDAQDKS